MGLLGRMPSAAGHGFYSLEHGAVWKFEDMLELYLEPAADAVRKRGHPLSSIAFGARSREIGASLRN